MRKTVIDGSNTGGFQRTALIGLNGHIKVGKKKIPIPTVCLEEEAARIEQRKNNTTIYKLNGLGIPLIEIATAPVIKSPKEAHKVAKGVGKLLRSYKVQRGIGTIRQDVNISIPQGARIEIKGVQELNNIPTLVKNEINRQKSLLEIKKKLNKRKPNKENFAIKNVTKLFRNSKSNIVKNKTVYSLILPTFKGLMKKECGGKRFGKELAYYARAFGTKGLIHNEEDLKQYKLKKEFKKLSTRKEDVVLIIAGPYAKKAIETVKKRALQCLKGVPKETRTALENGTTTFSRPLPGANRMYPETDIPPIRITRKRWKKIKTPQTPIQKEKELMKHLPKELASQIITSGYYDLFKEFSGFDPIMVATTLTSTMKDLKRQGHLVEKITKKQLKKVFTLVKHNKISKDALPKALHLFTKGKSIAHIEKKYAKITEKELENIIEKIISKKKGLRMKALMGLVMKKVKGQASGKKVANMLKKKLKEKR